MLVSIEMSQVSECEVKTICRVIVILLKNVFFLYKITIQHIHKFIKVSLSLAYKQI